MLIDRWRNWRPGDEKFEESIGYEPPKPPEPTFEGFEGSISEQMENISDISTEPDPNAWRVDFSRWLESICLQRPRKDDAISVSTTTISFAEWAIKHNSVPATRATMERLFIAAGFVIRDGMVLGLLLRSDLQAHGEFARYTARPLAADATKKRRVKGDNA